MLSRYPPPPPLPLLYEQVFVALDANRDGQCDLPEFLQFFELPKDRFTERIFKCMDVSSTGKLDFHDFVVGLWNYCKARVVCVEREAGRGETKGPQRMYIHRVDGSVT